MSTSSSHRVLLVGHCRPDAYLLKSAIERFIPDAQISMVGSSDALDAAVDEADLLLVNRVLDGYFRSAGGVPLIRELAARAGRVPALMLVSGVADAQREAEEAGAAPGISKSDLYSDQTAERLKAALQAN